MPVLRHEFVLTSYAPFEIVRAGLTTALFLIAATASWAPFLWGKPRRVRTASQENRSGRGKELLIFLGLGLGIVYYVAVFSGLQTVLGPLFGLVRSVMLTATLMACFMLGHARAQGVLRGTNWALAVGMGIIVAFAVATLFLIGGVIYCMAAVFGFVITRKRVPLEVSGRRRGCHHRVACWKSRNAEKYWLANNWGAEISITQVPGFLVEWSETGFDKANFGSKLQQCHRSRFAYSIALARATFIARSHPIS